MATKQSTKYKYISLNDPLYEYMQQVGFSEPDIYRRLREETRQRFGEKAVMKVSPDEGRFLHIFMKLIGVKRMIEVGVFTGYSSLSIATALPADGKLIALDISQEFTDVARKYWQEAGVTAKVDLRIAPAADSLQALLAQGQANSFDAAFIDADKTGYLSYYELLLQLIKPGGVILIDNVLWSGAVAEPTKAGDADTAALKQLNEKVHGDNRVEAVMLTLSDGVTIVRKK